jgi:hypothetical protein
VEPPGDREEAREAREVPHERLGLDLLCEVELRIGFQSIFSVGSGVDDRQRAPAQHFREIEGGAELRRHERMQEAAHRAPRQQVRARHLQLPGTRSAEGEAELAALDRAMDFVQEIGQPLDLVDDDGRAARQRFALGSEAGGSREEALMRREIEEIEARRVGQGRGEPGALADPTRAEEEEGAARGLQQARERGGGHLVVIWTDFLTAS